MQDTQSLKSWRERVLPQAVSKPGGRGSRRAEITGEYGSAGASPSRHSVLKCVLVSFAVEILLVVPAAVVPVIAGEERATEKKEREDRSPAPSVKRTDRVKDAQETIAKGLAYLVSQQNHHGSFGKGKRTNGNVGIASMAGLALLGAGNKTGKNDFADNIQEVVGYLLANSREDGLIRSPDAGSHGVMYEHAYATRFLAEVYSQNRDERVRKALTNAVMLIVASQNHEGGWRYLPTPMDADHRIRETMPKRGRRICLHGGPWRERPASLGCGHDGFVHVGR